MTVVVMGEDKPQMFHDFLGGEKREEEGGRVSWGSDGSERRGMNNSEVFHFHGRKNAMSEPEASNTILGRKRSFDSDLLGLRDRMLPLAPGSPDCFRPLKMIGKEVIGERSGRSVDEEMLFSTQLPPRPTSSVVLHPPASSRSDSLLSRWERPMNASSHGVMAHYATRLGQSGAYMDRLSSSYSHRDASSSGTFFSQTAADEGSRTGMKGAGMWRDANPSSGAGERNSTVLLPYSSRPRALPNIETKPFNVPSSSSLTSTTRQMTIFYGGQAHVFDDVHPNKADVIMALAGSTGGSWTTNFSPKKSNTPTAEVKIPTKEFSKKTRDCGNGDGDSLMDNKIYRFKGLTTLHEMPIGINPESQVLAHSMRSNSPLVIPGNLDGGLMQAARIPVTSDTPVQTAENLLAERIATDGIPAIPAAEPETEGQRNVS